MARKTMKLTEKKIQALLRSGRGRGEGADYLPWLQIGNFSSQGRSHRIRDHQNGRIHHLVSDLEADYYYILAWADAVVDIREQFPLLSVISGSLLVFCYGMGWKLLGAVFVGVGAGICVRLGGAPGGDDALAMSIAHITKWRIECIYLLTDIIVLLLSASYIPLRQMGYSVLTVILSGQIIGIVQRIKLPRSRMQTAIDG